MIKEKKPNAKSKVIPIKWKLENRKVSELKEYHKNPRKASEKEMEDIKMSVSKFGLIDKPAINHDNTIIGGHRRTDILKMNGEKDVDVWFPSRPLNDKEVEELNIRLNKNTGSFDFDILANQYEIEDLKDWGFEDWEFGLDGEIDKMEEGDEIEVPQSVQIEPPKEYILIMADPNSLEWEEMKEALKLKMVRRGGYKKGSAFDSVGLERVMEWEEFKKRLGDADSGSE